MPPPKTKQENSASKNQSPASQKQEIKVEKDLTKPDVLPKDDESSEYEEDPFCNQDIEDLKKEQSKQEEPQQTKENEQVLNLETQENAQQSSEEEEDEYSDDHQNET